MRRPVKPFVTEYKGPNRRPGHAAGTGQRHAGEDFSFTTAASEVFRNGAETSHRHNEDGYEAAMRAADALFSPVAAKPPARTPAPAQPDDPSAQRAAGEGAELAGGGTGRILRVLNEAPIPGLADPGVEEPPRRRGRKPGSKNKPKVAATLPQPRDLAGPTQPGFAARHETEDESEDAEVEATAPSHAPRQSSRTRDRQPFAWVRTKLRPGEAWKRRLPPVCW